MSGGPSLTNTGVARDGRQSDKVVGNFFLPPNLVLMFGVVNLTTQIFGIHHSFLTVRQDKHLSFIITQISFIITQISLENAVFAVCPSGENKF
jgi:hypothetical protein